MKRKKRRGRFSVKRMKRERKAVRKIGGRNPSKSNFKNLLRGLKSITKTLRGAR